MSGSSLSPAILSPSTSSAPSFRKHQARRPSIAAPAPLTLLPRSPSSVVHHSGFLSFPSLSSRDSLLMSFKSLFSHRIRRLLLSGLFVGFVVFALFTIFSGSDSTTSGYSYGSLVRERVGLGYSRAQAKQVPEIYGLLNLVVPAVAPSSLTGHTTVHHEHLLPSSRAQVISSGPVRGEVVDMSMYSPGEESLDWEERRKEIDDQYPIVVFGKSYCPYTRRILALFKELPLYPEPFIVQEDLRDDTQLMQDLLARLTGRRTVPNVIVRGQSIGGSDDVHALFAKKSNSGLYQGNSHAEGGRLREILEEGGVIWGADGASRRTTDRRDVRSWMSKEGD